MAISVSFHSTSALRWADNHANRPIGWLQMELYDDGASSSVCVYLRRHQAVELANWLLSEAETMPHDTADTMQTDIEALDEVQF